MGPARGGCAHVRFVDQAGHVVATFEQSTCENSQGHATTWTIKRNCPGLR